MTETTKIDKLRICLTIISTVVFVIGVFVFFTQNYKTPSTSLSPGWNILSSNGPKICIGATTIIGLILLRIAYNERDVVIAIIGTLFGILLPLMIIFIK